MAPIAVLLLVALISLSTVTVVQSAPTPEKLRAFEEWYMERHPETMKNFEIGTGSFDQARPGVRTKKDLEKGQLLFEIPKESLLFNSVVEITDIGEVLFKVFLRWSDGKEYDPAFFEALSLFVLYEKFYNPQSEWKPWLDILPEADEMENILFFRYSELKELTGSPLLHNAKDRRKEVKEIFDWHVSNVFRVYDKLFPEEPTEEMYKWAVSIVRSRNIMIVDGDIIQPALTPFFDLFRHTPMTDETQGSWDYSNEDEKLVVRSPTALKAGEEVLIPFGDKCNSELLNFYGFILEDNPNDCVHLDLEMSKKDPMWSQRNILFTASKIDPGAVKMLKMGVTEELLRAVRSITISHYEMSSEFLMGGIPDESLGPRSDLAVAHYIVNTCRKQYAGYGTTIEEDEERLKDTSLSSKARMSTIIRIEERKIIQRIGQYYHSITKELAEELKKSEHLYKEEL